MGERRRSGRPAGGGRAGGTSRLEAEGEFRGTAELLEDLPDGTGDAGRTRPKPPRAHTHTPQSLGGASTNIHHPRGG